MCGTSSVKGTLPLINQSLSRSINQSINQFIHSSTDQQHVSGADPEMRIQRLAVRRMPVPCSRRYLDTSHGTDCIDISMGMDNLQHWTAPKLPCIPMSPHYENPFFLIIFLPDPRHDCTEAIQYRIQYTAPSNHRKLSPGSACSRTAATAERNCFRSGRSRKASMGHEVTHVAPIK